MINKFMMPPKVIHYCWFGRNPLPPLALKCIASWKKFFPDCEIKEWNEDNFDVNMIPYTKEAYEAKKYAFVSDYARFWILYNYGGYYFDTDVEIVKSFEDIEDKIPFMGAEQKIYFKNDMYNVNPGLGLAAEKNNSIYKEVLEKYESLHFYDENGNVIPKTVCHYVSEILELHGLKRDNNIQKVDSITIFPADYFNPIDFVTHRMHITSRTHSIHWYMASWKKQNLQTKIKETSKKFIPEAFQRVINMLKNDRFKR